MSPDAPGGSVPFPPTVARALTRLLGGEEATERSLRLAFGDAGHGFDAFGLHPDFVAFGDALAGFAHDKWFRVVSYDAHHVPKEGPAVLAANHSGTLPFDGMMLWVDVLRNTDPPRA